MHLARRASAYEYMRQGCALLALESYPTEVDVQEEKSVPVVHAVAEASGQIGSFGG